MKLSAYLLIFFLTVLPLHGKADDIDIMEIFRTPIGESVDDKLREKFWNRCYEGLPEAVEEVLAGPMDSSLSRLFLIDILSDLGGRHTLSALRHLEDWTPSEDPINFGRLVRIIGIFIQLEDYPRALERSFQFLEWTDAVPDSRAMKVMAVRQLFDLYSQFPELFSLEKMRYYFEMHQEIALTPDNILLVTDYGILSGAEGKLDEARTAAAQIEKHAASAKYGSGKYTLFHAAGIWGWLGDSKKTVAVLEPVLREHADSCSSDVFSKTCSRIRKSPAYASLQNEPEFIALWERLQDYEPPVQCGS